MNELYPEPSGQTEGQGTPPESAGGSGSPPAPAGKPDSVSAGMSGARRAHTKKTLIIYAVLIATFVLVLVLVSFFNRMRAERLTGGTVEGLTSGGIAATDAQKNIVLPQRNSMTPENEPAVGVRPLDGSGSINMNIWKYEAGKMNAQEANYAGYQENS